MPLGTVVIFIEFPIMHWHFDPVLNTSVMVARVTMRVYMFHSRQFCTLVMSSFFAPTSHHPLRYSTDGESDSDSRLTPTNSVESNPDTRMTPTYSVESNLFEPSYPLMIRLTSDSSSSSAAPGHAPPPIRGRGFIRTLVVPRGHGDGALGGFIIRS